MLTSAITVAALATESLREPTGFDELINAPTRLEIVSLLTTAQWADVKYARDEIGLSDSALPAC